MKGIKCFICNAMVIRISLLVAMIGIVQSCGRSNSNSGDLEPASFESLIADVEIPMVNVESAVEKGKMEYVNYAIESIFNDETNETRYIINPQYKLVLDFKPSNDSSKGINVFATRYDSEDTGVGRLKNGRMTVKNQYTENIDSEVENLAYFSSTGKSKINPENTAYTMYIEDSLFEAIENATPETTYKSEDGMIIRLKLYRTPGHIDGVKAIVMGEIENSTEEMEERYEEDYSPYIYSVLTDSDWFYAEYQGMDDFGLGPRIHWCPDELTVPADKETGAKEIKLERVKPSSGGQSDKEVLNKEVLAGDFDGDGTQDHVWIEGEIGDDGFASDPLVLRSDNPKLGGLSWNAPCGVMLFNLGRLNDSDKDFLGAIPYAMSDWAGYEVYLFDDGKWRSEIEPFAVYLDSDEDFSNRVQKSNLPGYITVYENDMDGDDIYDLHRSEVRLNRR